VLDRVAELLRDAAGAVDPLVRAVLVLEADVQLRRVRQQPGGLQPMIDQARQALARAPG
jgi:hypothetical protein